MVHFGYEAEHYELSVAIGAPPLSRPPRAPECEVGGGGVSCREQIAHGTGRRARHLVEVLAAALPGKDLTPPAWRQPMPWANVGNSRPDEALELYRGIPDYRPDHPRRCIYFTDPVIPRIRDVKVSDFVHG